MTALIERLTRPGATLFFFAATLAILVAMQFLFPAELAVPLPGSDIRPVLLLEFAASKQHLVNIFGSDGDPGLAARIAGMTSGNMLDYLLMPSYGLLTLSFFAGVAKVLGNRRWLILGWLGVVAALADAIENAIMFRMVAHMANPASELAVLPYPVWLKFGLLALTCLGAAAAFAKMHRWVLALLCLPAPLLIVPAFLQPYTTGPLATSLIGLGWIAMAIHAVVRLRAERS